MGGGLQHFSVSPRPLGTNWGFELGKTGLGLGLGSLGPGLDKTYLSTLIKDDKFSAAEQKP